MSQVAHQAGIYLRFLQHEVSASISTPCPTPLDEMLQLHVHVHVHAVHHKVTPSIKFTGTHE